MQWRSDMLNSSVWDFWADKYDRLWVQKYSLEPSRREIIKALAPMLKRGRKYKLLDMGCGTGQLLRELQRTFKDFDIEYTGVDISSKMIEKCREQDLNTPYYVSNIDNFEANEEKFDFIICAHSFPYYQDKLKAIEKFHDLLNKDGILFLVQASENNIYDTIVMFFVKLTTSRAQYPSIKGILSLVRSRFTKINTIKIKEKFYMPTICLFLLKRDGLKKDGVR
jgi:ubiquinone/menaquinone biosynthesis C-methylase UbiE